MTVIEVIQKSAGFLARKGVDSPRLQVELLLAHVLKVPRMRLYLDFERVLNVTELDATRALVQRRGEHEPLQHILGSTSFCGLEIKVNANALIPRPETELLAEAGWTFLNSLTPDSNPTALDFGTGSGCLAITLACKCPAAKVTAVDISEAALGLARENAAAHGVASRLEFLQGNGFAGLTSQPPFDLIVANPPYIASEEIATLPPEVRDHDPRLALDGGADGLEFYHRLARESPAFLRPQGRLMVEFGFGQAPALEEIFNKQKWIVEAVKADYNAIPRILIARR